MLSTRALAALITQEHGHQITKSDLNSILYRERKRFESSGGTPPLWTLVQSQQRPNSSTPNPHPTSGQAPDQPATDQQARNPDSRAGAQSPETPQVRKSLRSWQESAAQAWKQARGKGVVEAVTGTGKTFLASWIIAKYISQGRKCLIVVPSVTLLNQWIENIKGDLNIEVGSVIGGAYGNQLDPSCLITIGVVNSIANHATSLEGNFDLLVADECHRYAGTSFQQSLLDSTPHRLGLTATLERSDEGVEEVLLPYFTGVCFKYGYQEAKRDEVIAPYQVLSLGVDLPADELDEYTSAGKAANEAAKQLMAGYRYSASFGDFMGRATDACRVGNREGQIARTYLGCIQKRKKILSETQAKLSSIPILAEAIQAANKSLVFCETIDSAEMICEYFNNSGVQTAVYHSKLDVRAREDILEEFQDSSGIESTDCLVAVRALDEGIDIPRVDCGIIIASTKQRRQMIQRMGRVVRLKPDGGGAAFIVLYAKDTAEDPAAINNPEDSHFSVLSETADQYEDDSLKDASAEQLERFVKKAVAGKRVDSAL